MGVDQGTIRNRVRRFKQDGFLKEFYLGVNPSIFGLKIASLWFDVHPQSEKDNVKDKLCVLDQTLLVCDYLGPMLSTVFCYESEADLKKTVRQITRMANSEDIVWQDRSFLPSKRSNLTPLDWRIIRSLQQGDPSRKSFSLVAREAGSTTPTVKKRIEKLVEDGAIYLLASMNLPALENFVPADLVVYYESSESRDKVNESLKEYLGDSLVFADLDDRRHGYFALALPGIARIREIQSWSEKREGVESVRVSVLQDILSIRRFYDERVENSLAVPIKVTARSRR